MSANRAVKFWDCAGDVGSNITNAVQKFVDKQVGDALKEYLKDCLEVEISRDTIGMPCLVVTMRSDFAELPSRLFPLYRLFNDVLHEYEDADNLLTETLFLERMALRFRKKLDSLTEEKKRAS
jgi:hypothetical protein